MSLQSKLMRFVSDIKNDYYGAEIVSIEVNKRMYDIFEDEFNSHRTHSGHDAPASIPKRYQFYVGDSCIQIKKAVKKVKYAKYLVKSVPWSNYPCWYEEKHRVGKQPLGAILIPNSEFEKEE